MVGIVAWKRVLALMTFALASLVGPVARSDTLSACAAKADADEEICIRKNKGTKVNAESSRRMAACDSVWADQTSACQRAPRSAATEGVAASVGYSYFCNSSVPEAEQGPCHRCVDEARQSPGMIAHGADPTAFAACRTRMDAERDELKTIQGKLASWQPRGYEGAGEGLEALSDADLDTVLPGLRAAMQRVNAIAIDVKGQAFAPADQIEQTVAETQGFLDRERACRANKKCMAVRATRKAEEQFFASVVSPMCEADKLREQARADMARERANPSGFVDARLLHDDGEQIQASEKAIADLTPEYMKTRHHAWHGWKTECQ